jgi:hypothetical protein
MNNLKKLKKIQGNVAFEYVIISAILVTVIVPLLPSLTDTLNTFISGDLNADSSSGGNLKLKQLGHSAVVTTPINPLSPLQPTSSGSFPNNSSTQLPAGSVSTISITLANGKVISIPNVPINPSQAIETVGGSGYSAALATSLIELAKALEESGELSSAQASDLINLANQGFVVAGMMQTVEDAFKQTGYDAKAFRDQQMTFNGKTYTGGELNAIIRSNTIGYSIEHNTDPAYALGLVTPDTTNYANGQAITELVALWETARANGAMSNPGVLKLVSALTQNIAASSSTLEASINQDFNNPNYVLSQSDINNKVASTLAASSSTQICTVGSGSSNGMTCQ